MSGLSSASAAAAALLLRTAGGTVAMHWRAAVAEHVRWWCSVCVLCAQMSLFGRSDSVRRPL